MNVKEKIDQYFNYGLIFCVSLAVLILAPFLSTTADLALNIPNTVAGWIAWSVVRIIVAALNVVIFVSFLQQGKVNVQNEDKFKEADRIIHLKKQKEKKVINPEEWQKKQYKHKGVKVCITTMLAAVGISQAIINYDVNALITYAITIGGGIVWGFISMKKAEYVWTVEYYDYAMSLKSPEAKLECEEYPQW